jgi:hypothetical protein
VRPRFAGPPKKGQRGGHLEIGFSSSTRSLDQKSSDI